jgi:hypothetical protein
VFLPWDSRGINHHQVEHQATVIEFAGMIANILVSVLIDSCATDNFIPPSSLIRCGMVSHDQNDFKLVEMALDVK